MLDKARFKKLLTDADDNGREIVGLASVKHGLRDNDPVLLTFNIWKNDFCKAETKKTTKKELINLLKSDHELLALFEKKTEWISPLFNEVEFHINEVSEETSSNNG